MNENKNYIRIKNSIGKLLAKLYNFKAECEENIPKEGAYVLAGNHRSIFDPCICIMGTNRIIHFLAKDTFYDKPIFKQCFKAFGCIRVDTKTGKSNKAAIDSGIEVLKKGEILGIFPEGTRNKTKDTLLKFHKGAAVMAQEANTKVIPFAVTGKYKLFSKDLTITYGKPFSVKNMTKKDATDLIRTKVEELILEKKGDKNEK